MKRAIPEARSPRQLELITGAMHRILGRGGEEPSPPVGSGCIQVALGAFVSAIVVLALYVIITFLFS